MLAQKDCAERYLEYGFCPQCNSLVVSIKKILHDGTISVISAKRKKAEKMFEENKNDIIREFSKSIKTGNKSNMGFRYGENVESRNSKGEVVIKRYSVDFNGTRELISS